MSWTPIPVPATPLNAALVVSMITSAPFLPPPSRRADCPVRAPLARGLFRMPTGYETGPGLVPIDRPYPLAATLKITSL